MLSFIKKLSFKRKLCGSAILLIFLPLLILFFLSAFNEPHPGNIFGIIISAVFLGGWFYFNRLWGKIKPVVIVFFSLFASGSVYAVILAANMLYTAYSAPPDGSVLIGAQTYVLILGAGITEDGAPGEMLQNRLDAALRYLTENEKLICVTTGGANKESYGTDLSESYVMAEYLAEHGISRDRIIMEDNSRNTFENVTFASEHIKKIIGTDNTDNTSLIIVSDTFHLWRAARTAEALGYTVYTVPGSTPIIHLPALWMREMFALTRDLIFN